MDLTARPQPRRAWISVSIFFKSNRAPKSQNCGNDLYKATAICKQASRRMPVFSEVIFTYCLSSSSPYHALLAPGSQFSGISLPFRHNRVCRLYVSWGKGCIPCLLSFFFSLVALLFYRHYNSLSVHSSIQRWRCRLDTCLSNYFDCSCY